MTEEIPIGSDVYQLSLEAQALSNKWFGDTGKDKDIVHLALSLCGEAGEFANIIKKVDRGSLNFSDAHTRYMAIEELTDAFIYILNIAALMKVDLRRSYDSVQQRNDARFTPERLKRLKNDRPN